MFNLLDPIKAAISKYKNLSSLRAIRGSISKLDNLVFSFDYTSLDQTLIKLNPKKASQFNDNILLKYSKKIKAFCLFNTSYLQKLIVKLHFYH